MSSALPLPEVTTTADGQERRVGIEIELAGIDLPAIVECVTQTFGGTVEVISPYEQRINNTTLGTFIVELDFAYLRQLAREQRIKGDTSDLEQLATDALGAVAKNIAPFEVVAPPIPLSQLEQMENIVTALRRAGAKGTYDAAYYAFGVHFNPELPAVNSDTLLRYFKAYLCLHDWLVEREDTDLTRKLTPFINPFSKEFCLKVLQPDYWPDMNTFMGDYLAANPSRNRALDLLPVLAYVDEARVQAAVADEKINKRPTLHYRLPNSDIDNPAWSLRQSWVDWLQVESLANDRQRLATVCHHYLNHLSRLSPDWLAPWKEQVQQWLINPSSV